MTHYKELAWETSVEEYGNWVTWAKIGNLQLCLRYNPASGHFWMFTIPEIIKMTDCETVDLGVAKKKIYDEVVGWLDEHIHLLVL